MSIILTSEQENIVRAKLDTGRYHSTEEVVETALRLLDEYERADAEWVADVREKIDAAIIADKQTPPIDGETFIAGILQRFNQTYQVQS